MTLKLIRKSDAEPKFIIPIQETGLPEITQLQPGPVEKNELHIRLQRLNMFACSCSPTTCTVHIPKSIAASLTHSVESFQKSLLNIS